MAKAASQAMLRIITLLRLLNKMTVQFGWPLGVRLALEQYGGRRVRTRTISVAGSPRLAARTGRGQSDVETLLHVWREDCYAVDLPENPTWIIDAGANVGYATVWFATRYPTATVIAIEPDPGNLAILRQNVADLPNVEVIPAALTAEPGTMDLIDTGEGPWAMRVGAAGNGVGKVVGQVECVTMHDLLSRFGIDTIDFLKVDIEGGELELFVNSAGWIDCVQVAVAELHDRYRSGCARAWFDATASFSREFSRGENWFAIR